MNSAEDFLDEDSYTTSNSANNREDRVNRINPQLGCSICRPNKGENRNRGKKLFEKDAKVVAQHRAAGRKAKHTSQQSEKEDNS